MGKSWGLPLPTPAPSLRSLLCQVQRSEGAQSVQSTETRTTLVGPHHGMVSAICADLCPLLPWHSVLRLKALSNGLCFLLGCCLPGPRIICFLTHRSPPSPILHQTTSPFDVPFRVFPSCCCRGSAASGLTPHQLPGALCPTPGKIPEVASSTSTHFRGPTTCPLG